MNLKSLIVSFALVTATSTAALADSAAFTVEANAAFSVGSRDARDHRGDGVQVRDHRAPRQEFSWYRPYRPVARPIATANTKLYDANGHRWSEYTGPIHASGPYSRGFAAITDATRIGDARQDFWLKGAQANTIQLRAVAGSTFVTSVLVEYGPGTTPQVVHVNRDLRDGAITIDLTGNTRAVYRIAVGGTSGQRSAYQIFAR